MSSGRMVPAARSAGDGKDVEIVRGVSKHLVEAGRGAQALSRPG